MSEPAGRGAAESPVSHEEPPVIRVVSGNPTAEEIAAVVAVLASAAGDAEPEPATRRSPWSDPAWRLVGPRTQRRGWRTSGLPR